MTANALNDGRQHIICGFVWTEGPLAVTRLLFTSAVPRSGLADNKL